MSLLDIENLSLTIGDTQILKGMELSVAPGEVMGLVGESGSGKSMTALTVMQLLPHAARATGRVTFDGIDILAATEDQMCALRGDDIGMVFQEPMTALNPVKTIGEQVAEGIRWHTKASRAEAEDRARKMLDRVGLPEAKFPMSRYPHELSGGQRQRVVIAIACALKPKLLVADEPTTALDVVLQAQILDLLRDLVAESRMGLLLISHDLAVVTEMADRITILRRGEVMEAGDTARTLSEQFHPYTRQLAQASMHVPARARPHGIETSRPLLQVESVTRDYPGRRTSLFKRAPGIRAVDDVSLSMAPGQSVALVGRSGCGKSTLARMILALDRPTSGSIRFRGETITGKSEAELKPARRDMQVVFQDPYGSFDPRQKVEKLVAEPLHVLEKQPTRTERREMVAHALHEVGLGISDMDKYPHEFSGGQRQRLSIARAIITRPKLVVADEPVSALDVSIRAQILDLFAELNQKLGIAYLFITHDLTVARAITDEVLVMHDGKIVERGKTNAVLDHPQSEAAKALVTAAPDLHRAIAKRLREQG
ncbi:ABC transporter ATP-binding protein [Mesorhizobium sp. M7A.F.Ca.CA.001.07.2.1]|uniref:ABC transporter ATP-binding protein n=9 Tax=Phyllobacteriaceae TaxID=69277 RepID=UPI000FCA8096|nr:MULTISPECIES: dipeptide ABC transporter ATP-binding protein [Mesorhizobium]RVB40063.1 ABC transporter ATP-binding protein [Mesorhizobium sp. M7A.F.Ca.CA.004.05.1.1]MCF6126813.1 dipeptide ABC transporter ATP-binding protein [Mesorhizobium ciceri]MCQ8816372.1 dipeptide ABC transporter ATP-binding protein [Mesorhizobium sp. SEMIA396]RUX66527.1 ABC transporter ATP-binding protein [Mesorhizobium sp. M7A.F.Ca.CA.004.08.2.1]RUX86467.1 ABC transporter ATP-binding protein [Mesorhizobium sp. M7A.F.Ca